MREDMKAEVRALSDRLYKDNSDEWWNRILPELKKLVEVGNVEAALVAGQLLCHGWDIDPDYDEAMRLLQISVDGDVDEARAPLIYSWMRSNHENSYADMFKSVVGKDFTNPHPGLLNHGV